MLMFVAGAVVGAVLVFVVLALAREWQLSVQRPRQDDAGAGDASAVTVDSGSALTPRSSLQTLSSATTQVPEWVDSVEEIPYRCEECGQPFAVLYNRTRNPENSGDTVIRAVSIGCPRRTCRHTNLVLLPMNSRGVMVREWQGAEEVVPHPTLHEVVAGGTPPKAGATRGSDE